MTLIIALGNPQRGDDGAAAELCRLIGPGEWTVTEAMELTPEMAETVSGASRVIIADADYRGGEATIQDLSSTACCPAPLTHSLRPGDLIATARRLYGFQGQAWLLRIPGADFGLGQPVSATAKANIAAAAQLLGDLLDADRDAGYR
jgi:hydrogenase maturation protease